MLGSATCPFVLWALSYLEKKLFISSNEHVGQLQRGKKTTFALGIGSRSFQISRSNLHCDSNPSRGTLTTAEVARVTAVLHRLPPRTGDFKARLVVGWLPRRCQSVTVHVLSNTLLHLYLQFQEWIISVRIYIWAGIRSCWERQPPQPAVWPSPERCCSGSCLQPWSVSHTVLVKWWRHRAQLCGLYCN